MSDPEADPGGTTIFFPLRTSVELFEDPKSPAAVVRAKEAAILYDRLIFETGVLDVSVGTGGLLPWWFPPAALTPERRANARRVIPLGEEFSMAIGEQAE
jgi:hypothetical protein